MQTGVLLHFRKYLFHQDNFHQIEMEQITKAWVILILKLDEQTNNYEHECECAYQNGLLLPTMYIKSV